MRTPWSRLAACCTAGMLAITAGACSSSDSSSDAADGKVTITVTDMPPTTQGTLRKQFTDQVAAFERANPDIVVKPSEAVWDAKTFAARLAGGQLETAFIVPLTEPQGLINRHQIADITDQVKSLPSSDQFDKRALAPGTDAKGHNYGLPTSEFALSLVYNRELFKKAGLDPDDPPKTWDEVRQDAKAISEKTGLPGYAQPTTNNTGGWTLTAMAYTYGGRIEKEEGGKQVAAFNDTPVQQALDWLKALRWQDNSMGTQQLRDAGEIQKSFSAGRIGMMMATPSTYVDHITKYNGDPKIYGVAALPSASRSATMLGGKMAVINPKASPAQREAAVKWIDYYYLRAKHDPAEAGTRAKAEAADGIPVGTPTVPLYQPAVSGPVDEARNEHATVPLENFEPFINGVKQQEFVVEPAVAAQDVYAALDTAVAAVLTRKSADPQAELDKAEKKAVPALERAQR
ncbi:extracellular solute-binding protein [Streptomyces sp. NBC_01707]|uniref:ABC transporter substrate-binding protein n=1 Tax=unclassified Streptomyces TaxID=2593676 RepID=UPI0008906CD6|nr:extracellular solute-binding protein [Streptomyces sp. 136MFCol5.1]SCY15348.1 ABC-type glycerol-3-phosphate transport system, substrate-binding protein [Streptomyces sp. 136MFCol5.1]